MPNTHRRRRRDSTVELSRVGGVNAPSVVVTQFTIFCAVELLRLVTSDVRGRVLMCDSARVCSRMSENSSDVK